MLQYLLSDLVFETETLLPELTPIAAATPAAAEARVVWRPPVRKAEMTLPGSTPYTVWRSEYGEDWLTFYDVPGGCLLRFPNLGCFELRQDASEVWVQPFVETPPETTRHLLINQVMPLAISHRGRFVLHASAVSIGGRVTAFIGRSGAGKSTLAAACAAAGAAIVSDDCLVVRRTAAGEWLAVPCHAGLRLWPSSHALLGMTSTGVSVAHYSEKERMAGHGVTLAFEARTLPLRRIIRLIHPIEHALHGSPSRVLRGQQAMLALSTEVFRLDARDAEETARHFATLAALAAAVPVEERVRQARPDVAASVLCKDTN